MVEGVAPGKSGASATWHLSIHRCVLELTARGLAAYVAAPHRTWQAFSRRRRRLVEADAMSMKAKWKFHSIGLARRSFSDGSLVLVAPGIEDHGADPGTTVQGVSGIAQECLRTANSSTHSSRHSLAILSCSSLSLACARWARKYSGSALDDSGHVELWWAAERFEASTYEWFRTNTAEVRLHKDIPLLMAKRSSLSTRLKQNLNRLTSGKADDVVAMRGLLVPWNQLAEMFAIHDDAVRIESRRPHRPVEADSEMLEVMHDPVIDVKLRAVGFNIDEREEVLLRCESLWILSACMLSAMHCSAPLALAFLMLMVE
ncbi:hypothetical protein KCV07_g305, partial [Aureobasidium melanogenum]